GASRSEQRTHNPSVAGSSPAWATRHGDRVRHRSSLPVGLAATPPAWDDEGSEPVTQGALMTPDDALTAYVRRHAATALEHLVCVAGAADADIAAAMTVDGVPAVRAARRRP